MARRKKGKAGRKEGSVTLMTRVDGAPWEYFRPAEDHGKWRARRRPRDGAVVSPSEPWQVVLEEADSLETALADVRKRAEREAEEAQAKTLPPSERPIEPITLDDGWTAWMREKVSIGKIRVTTSDQLHWDSRVVLRALGPLTLAHEVALKDLKDFMATQESLAGSTRLRFVSILRRFFKFLVENRHVVENPMDGWNPPAAWRQDVNERADEATDDALEVEDARKLLRAASEPYQVDFTPEKFKEAVKSKGREPKLADRAPPENLYLAIAIALLTGLRKRNVVGEAALRWTDLDLTAGKERLTIDKDRMKSKRKFSVPICSQLAHLLRKRRRAGDEPLGDRVVGDVTAVRRSFTNAVTRAGLEVTFHSLRRTFATWLEDPAIGNAGFAALARLLDHSRRSKVTLRYPKATDAALREAVNRLPNLLGPEEPAKTAKAGS